MAPLSESDVEYYFFLSVPSRDNFPRTAFTLFNSSSHSRDPRQVSECTVPALPAGLSRLLAQSGRANDTVGTMPTVLLAGFRGFMLDYRATRDRARIQKALACWADALEGRNQ